MVHICGVTLVELSFIFNAVNIYIVFLWAMIRCSPVVGFIIVPEEDTVPLLKVKYNSN
jgi:hypothetical protein